MRPLRAENPDTFNGSDVPQDSSGVVSTPPSSPTAAPSSSYSSSAASKDEGKDESATSDIHGGISNSSSGGNNQNEDISNKAAIDPPASDGNNGLEEDQAAASSVAMEIDTSPPLGVDSAALLPIPATAPTAPSFSSSSATSMEIQEDKKVSKDDGWQDSGKDKEDVTEVDKEVDVEMEMETEGEGEVEVQDEVKEAEKEVGADPNALEDTTSGLELKSEISEVTSKDSADPVSTTDEGVATLDTTGVEESHLSVTESTQEGIIVDLLPVKSEIKEESASSSSSSTSASSTTTSAAAAAPTPNVDSTIVKSEKVSAVLSTDVSFKATVTEPAAVVVPPIMPETLPRAPDTFSAIHSLRGYLDVGSTSLFAPSEPWVLATASLLMKRKLSKS